MKATKKILFIDTSLSGHHQTYLRGLIRAFDGQKVICAPSGGETLFEEIERYDPIPAPGKSWYLYLKMMVSLIRISAREKPDIVHFVYGDALYRFGGLGFGLLRGKKIITCHQFLHRNKLALAIYRRFARASARIVVHTALIAEEAKGFGISNVTHVEYPQFNQCSTMSREEARRKLGLPEDDTPVILALGGTRYHKGLDILLKALNQVKSPFYLLVAGKPEYFQEAFIAEHGRKYLSRVILRLAFLTEEEVDCCIHASDIVALPYRKQLDRASGPLGEGVYRGKMIVGPAHGSIGQTIREYHLGLTFEAENIANLAETLEQALTSAWKPDEKYREYQELLNPKRFEAEYAALYQSVVH